MQGLFFQFSYKSLYNFQGGLEGVTTLEQRDLNSLLSVEILRDGNIRKVPRTLRITWEKPTVINGDDITPNPSVSMLEDQE